MSQLRDQLAEERGSQRDLSRQETAALSDMQVQLDLERGRMLDMSTALQKERSKVQVGMMNMYAFGLTFTLAIS